MMAKALMRAQVQWQTARLASKTPHYDDAKDKKPHD